MNRNVVTILLLYLIALSDVYGVENNKIDSIVIKLAPWHITTPSDVTCFNFENDISYKEFHISDSIIISKIVRELRCLKKSRGKTMDVRCKIYFYSQGKTYISTCIDLYHVLYDGVLYQMSPSLKKTIDSVTRKYTAMEPVRTIIPTKKGIPFPHGRDSLYTYLFSKLEDVINTIENPIALIVNCQIDSQGNTMKVIITDRHNTKLNDDSMELISALRVIFMKDIKWIPNKERFPFDCVTIPVKIGDASE